jgi:hypothetical protein
MFCRYQISSKRTPDYELHALQKVDPSWRDRPTFQANASCKLGFNSVFGFGFILLTLLSGA